MTTPLTRTRTRNASAVLLAAALAAGLAPAVHAMGLPRTPFDRRLTVTYDDGAGDVRTYTVACGVPYDVGDGGPACEQLERIGGPVGPVPSGQACSMIYGGPQSARVTGMWDGRLVDETYRRTNGCEVARWERMEPVLPSAATPHMHPLAG